ncbi:MAG: type IV toxin-antitoxin system AbiEi family antitoxin domain-containing protein [Oscillospiraceae bacterium]|nr:type IV toxin-antitoxin system AbiEi family antitoxin domain-containing protein [Oscillospiraceae bacterium]
MTPANPLTQISDRIKASEPGALYVASDFSDIADNDSIRKSLSRLAESGVIRRIIRGVYEFPEYSNFLDEYVEPSPHNVALAIARNFTWTIVPNGDTALNQLGLSTQVPAEWTYVSDGPYKEYSFDKTRIRFSHTANKDISRLPYKSALLVQAIKALGKERVGASDMTKISRLLDADEKASLLSDGQYMTVWVYDIIKSICSEVMTA